MREKLEAMIDGRWGRKTAWKMGEASAGVKSVFRGKFQNGRSGFIDEYFGSKATIDSSH